MKSIAVIRTGGIGDVILSFVFFNVLKRHSLSDIRVFWIGRGQSLDLVCHYFPFIIPVEIQGKGKLWPSIREVVHKLPPIDSIIDLQRSSRTVLLSLVLYFKYNSSYTTWDKRSVFRSWQTIKSYFRGRFYSKPLLVNSKKSRVYLMAEASHLGICKAVNCPVDQVKWQDCKPSLNQDGKRNSLFTISVVVDALFDKKSLPENKWIDLLNKINSAYSEIFIQFLGEEPSYYKSERIAKAVGLKNYSNHCGMTTLIEASQLLNKGELTLSNDSALAHLSEALGVPVMVFFGPTIEAFGYLPYLTSSQAFSVRLGCRPCSKSGSGSCRYGDRLCFQALNTNEISTQVLSRCYVS